MPLKKDQYDPNAIEETPRSSLVTRKDFIRGTVIMLILAALVIPVYRKMMDDRDKHLCKRNLGDISKAMLLYASANSDRFPPIYAMDRNGEVIRSKSGSFTWISNLSPYATEPIKVFKCPACANDENTLNEGDGGKSIESSYGMFAALSARPLSDVANQAAAVMLSETSNLGAQESYDP
ncbi:MAG: hypothetical protein ABL962_11185, partial [Fimbriimonadaceae bacterium]